MTPSGFWVLFLPYRFNIVFEFKIHSFDRFKSGTNKTNARHTL